MVVEERASLTSSAAELWPLVSDTDRTNRLIVGEAVEVRPIEGGRRSLARFVGRVRVGGFALEYDEEPFEWIEGRSFAVTRRMRGGPLVAYRFQATLEPRAGGGTEATFRLELTPRYRLLAPLLVLQGRKVVRSFVALAERIDAHLAARGPSPFDRAPARVDHAQLARALGALRASELDRAIVLCLGEHLRAAPDEALIRLRPFELADRHGLDRRETLRVCLHAALAGALELRWGVVCPSCRTASEEVRTLGELPPEGHCQHCDLAYGIELDRLVEATFRPHPSVRVVSDATFCIGGPWRTPHVFAQVNLEDGAEQRLVAPRMPGRYRLFARGGRVASLELVEGAPSDADVVVGAEGLSSAAWTLSPGASLLLRNESGAPLHVKLERLEWASLAATAHEVTTLPDFRRMFSKDLLKPSTPLRVASAAILFSDLTGSTALYSSAGDAAAFRLVDDHFDVLRQEIARAGGTIVKTMGDAVMAAFLTPKSAALAALGSLRAFETFRATHEHGADTGLKLGVFAGPCYLVTANAAIDYFGQTVNCAARVQHLAESGEVVVSREIFEALTEAQLEGFSVSETFEARVKGVDVPLALVRVAIGERAPRAG